MDENEVTRSHHAIMEVMKPLDMNLSLLSDTENLPDDVILISPLTPSLVSLPALEKQQIWMDTECEDSSNADEPYSVKSSDSIRETDLLFGSELIPSELMQKGKAKTHKCSECIKVFRTPYALNKHMLTHQPERSYVCNICQKGFKRSDHLTSHMLIHQKRKTYHCSHPGCTKMYCGYRSLKRHYAIQHRTYPLTPTSQPSTTDTKTCPPQLKPPKLSAINDGASTSVGYPSLISPPKPQSVFQFEGYTSCGPNYNNYTLAANLSLSHNPEDPKLSQVKLPVISQLWSLVADGASCSLESALDLSASHSMLMSNQWESTSSLGGSMVDTVEPEAECTWEHNLDFLVPQTWKEAPSIQPSKEVTGTGTASQQSSACPRKNQPILLKPDLPQHEPQNKQHPPLMSGEASCTKSKIIGSSEYHMEPIIPSLSPPRKFKTKKKRVKNKILKVTNIPTPPLPFPRPGTQRHPRPHPAYRVSPSQVAMASFCTESSPSDMSKSTAQGGSATARIRHGRESGERMDLKYPPSTHAQPSLSHPQSPPTFDNLDQQLVESISSTKGGSLDMVGDWYKTEQEVQLSPIVIPVSVPVSSKDAKTFNKFSRHEVSLQIEKNQKVKTLSKKSYHPGLLKSLITPNLVAGGYPSQLRSPTYLADHLLNFDPPPYTPPPMLSPLRGGTGLYFNTVPQYQPCLNPPNIYSDCLDGKDGISLILDNTVVSIKPKINVGSRFQAEIPPIRNSLLILYDEHPAQLVWAPWGDLNTNPETQKDVTEFLNMCCSSVLPGGGTNTELALHCLHEVQGDILAALDLLLVRGDYRTSCHPLSDYHYTGSDHWTAQEMRVFQKALLNQTKDFQEIHKALKTKSVAQCVEYYYTMKKLKKFKQRCRGIENTDGAEKNSVFS